MHVPLSLTPPDIVQELKSCHGNFAFTYLVNLSGKRWG